MIELIGIIYAIAIIAGLIWGHLTILSVDTTIVKNEYDTALETELYKIRKRVKNQKRDWKLL